MKKAVKAISFFICLTMVLTLLSPLTSSGMDAAEEWIQLAGASSSSNAIGSLGPDNLIDGDSQSFWSSAIGKEYPDEGDYAAVSVPGTALVSKIAVTPRKGFVSTFPRDFRLQYSTDKKTWLDIPGQSYTDYPAEDKELVFVLETPVEAKQVRIVGTRYGVDDYNTYYMQLAEIRLFGRVTAPPNSPIWGSSPISEPYDYVADGSFSGAEQPASPDPLVSYRWDNPTADDSLEIFLRKPQQATTRQPDSFTGLDTLAADSQSVRVTGEGTIQLDFGAEFAGWLEIDSPDLTGEITLGVSEYNQPAFVNSGPKSPSKTAVPVKYGDTYRVELNDELYEGVRFGFINITKFDKPFTITGVRLVCQTKPVNYNGSFDSDNEMLNKIWYTAAYDVRANLKKDYFAAILVDRGDRHSWTGDAYTAQAAALAAFGNTDFVLENLRYTSQRSNGIESYELYWILSLIDYYEYTGDRTGVESLLDEATKRLDHAHDLWGTNVNLGFFGWDERLGAGFENPNIPENQASYKLLSIQSWKEFASVLRDLGRLDLADRYQGYADQRTEEVLSDESFLENCGLHASSDAINAGIVPEDRVQQIEQTYFSDRVNRLSYSPFNQYFILQAMGKTGEYDDAISSILDLWGGQVEYGGTTFFETYRPQWNDEIGTNGPVPNNQAGYTSLAHPWSAGVLPWMSEELLGIKAAVPGFSEFEVKPHLGRQLTRVSGSTPTPYGNIEASFNTETGECSVVVPEGTTAQVGIPKTEKTITGITMNGVVQDLSNQDESFVLISGLTAGTYQFRVSYEGQTPAYVQPAYEYDAQYVGEDAQTQGSWGGVYGSEGYVLCSYNGGGSDVQVLPEYVDSVRYLKANSTQWSGETDDPRALPSNSLNLGSRKLGTLFTNDPIACHQTFTVDINLKEERPYTVALYFVDWEKSGRELAVEMFDGESLNLVAPVKVVDDYAGGKYLIYQYDKSVRFRIDQMRGPNATLSGIFFGEGMGDSPVILTETTDDQAPEVSYEGSWTHDPMPGAYANTFSYSNVAGNSAAFTFEGTGISFLSSLESNRGCAEIFLDGVSRKTVDLYSPSALRQQEVFRADGLSDGPHTIQVVVKGEKNSSAVGAYVDVDAFVVRNKMETPGSVAKNIVAVQPKQGETQLTIPTVPDGFTVALTGTENPDVIALDGTIIPQSEEVTVTVTFTVTKDGISADAAREITVPAAPPVPAQTDKTILNKVLAYAKEAKAGSEYAGAIASVKTSFDAAYSEAQTAAEKAGVSQQEIDSAWIKLMREIHKLGFQAGEKQQLVFVLSQAEELKLENYVTAGKEAFTKALAQAQGCMKDGDAMQNEVDESVTGLIEAMLELRLKADKSLLKAALAKAEKIDTSAYTEESVEVYSRAAAEAEELADNEELTAKEDQGRVNAAAENLEKAIKGLIEEKTAVQGDSRVNGTAGSPKTGEKAPAAGAAAVLLAGACLVFRKRRR